MIRKSLFAAVLLAALPAHQAAAQKYNFKTIKYGKMNTSMHDINTSGTAVGGEFQALGDVRNCFILTGNTKTTLSNPKGTGGTECWGLNSKGTIVGDYLDANGNTNGYIYSKSVFTDIAPPKSTLTVVYGVNDSNVAIGYYVDNKGVTYGFLFDGTTYTKLAVKNASSTQGFGIDNAGNYTEIAVLSDGLEHSYLVSASGSKEIIFPNITQVAAHHMNGKGQISATVIDSNNADHAGVYDSVADAYYVIDDPKGQGLTIGDGIDNKQTLVGRYNDSNGNSFGYVAKGKLK